MLEHREPRAELRRQGWEAGQDPGHEGKIRGEVFYSRGMRGHRRINKEGDSLH